MKKKYKILLTIGVFLAAILLIGLYYLNTIAEKVVWTEVNKVVEEQSEDYEIEIGEIQVRILLKRIVFRNVQIRSKDSSLIERKQHFDLSLDKLTLKFYNYTEVFNEGKLVVKDLEIHQPSITIVKNKSTGLKENENKEVFESKQLKSILLGAFGVNKGGFKIYNIHDGKKTLSSSGNNVDLLIKDIFIDLNKKNVNDRLKFDGIKMNIGEFEFHELKKHELKFSELIYTNKKKGVFVKNISFKNDQDLAEFKEVDQAGSAWTNINSSNIHFIIDLDKLGNQELSIQTLELGNIDCDVYSIANDNDSSKTDFVNPMLKINFPITVDSVIVKNGKGLIQLMKDDELSEYPFKNLLIQSYSISNDSNYINDHPKIEFDLSAKFWKNTSIRSQAYWDQKKNTVSSEIHLEKFPQSQLKNLFQKNNLGELYSCSIDAIDIEFFMDSLQYQGQAKLDLSKINVKLDQLNGMDKLDHIGLQANKLNIAAHFIKEMDQQLDIQIDSILLKKPKCIIVEKSKYIEKIKPAKGKNNPNGPLLSVNYLNIEKASFSYYKKDQTEAYISLSEINFLDRFIFFDFSKRGKKAIINTGSFALELKDFNFYSAPAQYLSITRISAAKATDKIKLKGLRYKNKKSKNDFHNSSKEGNLWLSAYIEELDIKTAFKKILNDKITIEKVEIIKPILTYINAIDREEVSKSKEKEKEIELDLPIYVNEVEIVDADIDIRVKTNKKREFEVFDLTNLNGFARNIDLDKKSKQIRSSIYGKVSAAFYGNGKLEFDFQHSQRDRNAKTEINGKLTSISLSTLKDRMVVFSDLNYENGSISQLDFDIEMQKDKVEGEIVINDLNVEQVHLSENEKGDWFTLNLEKAIFHFDKDKKKAFNSKTVSLINPQVDIHHPKMKGNKVQQKRRELIVARDVLKKTASIELIKIKGGRIRQFDGYDKLLPLTSVNNIDLTGTRVFLYDSTNTILPIFISDLDLELKNIIVHSLPHHDLTISSLNLDLKNKKARIKNLEFKNKNTPEEFYKGLKYRKAWMDLIVPSMEIDVDIHEFFSLHPRIRKANIQAVKFITHVNLALEVSPLEKPLPNRILYNATFPLTVDSILINDGMLDVRFHDKEKYGLLQYNSIKGMVSNLSTDKERTKKNDVMKWVMDATMWKTGDTHVEVDYNLNTELDDFTMRGHVINMELIDTDTLTKKLYGIKVNNGFLYRAEFDIKGNNNEASGIVQFDYDALNLGLEKKNAKSPEEIKKTKKKDKLNESFVKSMVVNGLLRTKNTPEKGKYIKTGNAYFQREKNKPIFHLMWYTLSSGILEIAEAGLVKDMRQLKEGFNFKKNKKEE